MNKTKDNSPYRLYPDDSVQFPDGNIPQDVLDARAKAEDECEVMCFFWQGKTRDELLEILDRAEVDLFRLRWDEDPSVGKGIEHRSNIIAAAQSEIENGYSISA